MNNTTTPKSVSHSSPSAKRRNTTSAEHQNTIAATHPVNIDAAPSASSGRIALPTANNRPGPAAASVNGTPPGESTLPRSVKMSPDSAAAAQSV